jgi:hypothetical protein
MILVQYVHLSFSLCVSSICMHSILAVQYSTVVADCTIVVRTYMQVIVYITVYYNERIYCTIVLRS